MQSRKLNIGLGVLVAVALMAFVGGIVAVFNGLSSGSTPTGNPQFNITVYPQPTLALPGAPTPVSIIATPEVAAPAVAQQYVVQQNDTMWDIAVKFGVSLDQIVAANPHVNPDLLGLGQTLNIPPASFVAPPRPTDAPRQIAPSTTQGKVLGDAGGVRLREQPSTDAAIITKLGPDTELEILGEVAGQTWLRVVTPNGTQGWVMAQYVAIGGATVLATADPSVISAPTPIPVGPLEYPYLSDMSARVYEIYRTGQALGNRANGVVLVGDSNTDHPQFFAPFDWGNYNLGNYPYLQSTVDFFKGSFAQNSLAAKGGFNTNSVLGAGPCGDTNLACAYNNARPSVALILLGTGDQHSWQGFEERYRQIVQYTIQRGIIPVLITKADDLECRDNNAPCGFINSKIATIASQYQVPLLNLRQIVERLPNGGCNGDGFHYNFPAGERSAWFTPDYLQYGYTQRNLTALQTLDVIRRKVIQPG